MRKLLPQKRGGRWPAPRRAFLLVMSLFSAHSLPAAEPPSHADFHVSPLGSDQWSGTQAHPNAEKTDGPFATLWDFNLYWQSKNEPFRFLRYSFQEWKNKGLDTHSIIADPLFLDPAKNDYRLRPESPAFKLGFRPIDLGDVGPRPHR